MSFYKVGYLLFLFSLASCGPYANKESSEIINDAFLQIIDSSIVYQHANLLPAPNQNEIENPDHLKLIIGVNNYLRSSIGLQNEITIALQNIKGINTAPYFEIFRKYSNDTTAIELGKGWLQKAGPFIIRFIIDKESWNPGGIFIGEIEFYKPIFDDEIALLSYNLKGRDKSWKIGIVLLRKVSGKWKLISQQILVEG